MREIGSRWELFVDQWLLDRLTDARLRLHHPTPRDVALTFDAPWEGPGAHYATVLSYEDSYRLYYRGHSARGAEVTAVATSTDGIGWQRPNLGLIPWQGSTANNIVWQGRTAQNFTPFVDQNPAAPAAQRFKAVGSEPLDGKPVLRAFVSADGFHWQPLRTEPIITDGAFDSQNLVYWDALRGHYVAFYRHFRDEAGNVRRGRDGGVRSIKVATSASFEDWPPGQWLDFGAAPLEHFYTNATIAYPRAPHLYLAFPKRFVPERKRVPEHESSGISDGILMSSRDGFHWDRTFLEAFLRPGRDRENWTDRSSGIAWGLVQTAPDELSLYWIEHYRWPSARLRRGTLRLDGFASLYAGYGGGEAVTHPILFAGAALHLNYATSAAGSVRVELQDETGQPLPGYTLADCVELYGDAIEEAVSWQSGADLSTLAGRPVRLRLALQDADIYALRFGPGAEGDEGKGRRN